LVIIGIATIVFDENIQKEGDGRNCENAQEAFKYHTFFGFRRGNDEKSKKIEKILIKSIDLQATLKLKL